MYLLFMKLEYFLLLYAADAVYFALVPQFIASKCSGKIETFCKGAINFCLVKKIKPGVVFKEQYSPKCDIPEHSVSSGAILFA